MPAVVARVEASARRSELSALYVFEAVATAALAVLLWHFWLPAVLLLAALDGTAALAASALLRAEVARPRASEVEAQPADDNASRREPREISAQEAERKANAALNVAFSVTFVAGPVLGGAVVAAAGAPAALFIDVGSFLICGALLIDLHPHVEEAGGDSVRARLRAAWRHINEAPALRGLLLAEAVALVFFQVRGTDRGHLRQGDPARRRPRLRPAPDGMGSRRGAREPRLRALAAAPAGSDAERRHASRSELAYVGFAAAPSLGLACVAALLGGVGNGLEWPSLISLVQRLPRSTCTAG